MPLTEQRRQQLDGIVQQMLSNGEPDGNIQFVVNDFKTKYESENQSSNQDGFFKSVLKGVAKPFLQVGLSAGRVGQSIGNLVKGNVNEAGDLLSRPANLPFFGQIKPAFTGQESTLEAAKKMGGYGLEIGTTIAPVGKAVGLGKKVAQFSLAGSGYELGRQLDEGENLSLKKIASSGAFSAALPIAGEGIRRSLKQLPKTAWNAILKPTPSVVAKNPKLAQEVAETGITGITKKGLSKQFGNRIQQLEVSLDDVLTKKTGTINGSNVASYLDDLKNTYSNIPGEQSAVDVIERLQKDVTSKGKLSLPQANQLKRDIYGLISKSYGKGSLEIPAKVEAQKVVASGLKQEIEKIIPEVKNINQKQAVYIQAKKAIDQTIARQAGKGIAGTNIGMLDLLTGGIGSVAGGPLLGLKLAIGKKVAESPATLTRVAKYSNKLTNTFNNLSPTKKVIFYNALRTLGQETIGGRKN